MWEEHEIVKLRDLFNEFQDSENVMDNIMQNLTVKRTKQAVVEKLLEIGSIQDKKEIRKKRTSKKLSKGRENNSDEHSEDSTFENFIESFAASVRNERRLKRRILSDSSDEEQVGAEAPDSFEVSTANSSKKAGSVKRPPKVWNEQEIIQLHNLFRQHQGSPDVVQSINDELTIKRPKEKIIEKLLELGLIQDRKEIRKKRTVQSKKHDNVSEVWDESELIQLHDLYNEHKNSANVVQNIVNDLTVKHSKKAVIEKLLQLGLVQDRKELKKKQISKVSADNKEENSDLSKVWNESEVIQLHNLFAQYKNSIDVAQNIVNNLAIKRSKKMVVQKLLEFGLIQNKKEIQKTPVSSEAPKIWDECEIIQLHNLFSQYKNSPNGIQSIINDLTIKRKEKTVIEKLIELGLIKDKKELQNKRILKSKNESKKSDDSKVWDEMEIVQLHNLFYEHKTSDDPIQNILNNLTANRSRSKVLEKLLELGLIKDEKEVTKVTNRQKGTTKTKVNKVIRNKTKSAAAIKNKGVEDSSDDELPLIHSFSTERVENLAESSDDELPLIHSFSTERVENLPESSDDDDLPLSHKKVNMSDVRKKLQILISDSSDDELLFNQKVVKSPKKGGQYIDQNLKIGVNDEDDPILKEVLSADSTSDKVLHISFQDPSAIISERMTNEEVNPLPSSNYELSNFSVSNREESIPLNLETSKTKRKRIIYSDESSDDNDVTVKNKNDNSAHIDENLNVENSSNSKMRKKKICVLQDSDDSS